MAKIKKDTSLRKAILQAAITGQLISNVDGETETGKQLLDRIIEERNAKLLAEWEEALKKNPKAKKPTPVVASEIDEEEIPFEIPENWCWCRFGEIMINRDSERIPLSVSQRELLEKNYDYYGASGVIDKVDKYLFDKDLLLIGEDGANLLTRSTPIAFIASGKYWVNNHAHVLDCDSNNINMNYIKFFINAISLAKYVTGTAQPKMNQEKMNSIPVALPPLSVQNAIVAKLEEVLPLVDAYENAVLQKEELKSTLPDTLKKAILQEAIQGKLTEDWRKTVTIEETGKQLLDRIIEERESLVVKGIIKKENSGKTELDLSSMEFDIPENWVFVELQQIFRFVDYRGMTPNKNGHDVFLITASNIRSGFMDYTRKEYISRIEYNNRQGRGITKKGDLLFTTEAPMGNAAICDLEECSCGQRIITFQNFDSQLVNLKLYMYFINAPAFQKQLLDNCTGTTAKGIKSEKLQRLLLPLPPLAEQEKIVEIIEQMLPLCEKLGE